LSCLAASLFWVTSERLAMTTFTTPISTDKIVLWIENPSSGTDTVSNNLSKVLLPFDKSLWIALLLAVCGVSILSVWFADENGERRKWWHKLRGEAWARGTLLERARIFGRVLLDSFLAQSTSFFGQPEFDVEASLPMKILKFGFGFVILITVAAYTANLAAYLTISAVGDYVGSMDEAITTHTRVCGQLALRHDLQKAWPTAQWVFNTENPHLYDGMLENFDAGLCEAMASGIFDVQNDPGTMVKFCKRNIVATGSLVLEKPLALPVCSKFAAGLSYWMAEADEKGITFDSFEENARPPPPCSLRIEAETSVDELLPLTALNLALPFLVLLVCSVIAIILHLTNTKHLFSSDSEINRRSGSVSKGTDDLEKSDRIKAAGETDSLEQPESVHGASALELPHSPSSSESSSELVLPPMKEMLSTMRDLQGYQNNLIEKIIAEEKKEK
jgi:hypothetical protein